MPRRARTTPPRSPASRRCRPAHLRALRRGLVLGPDEGRIAEDEGAALGRQHVGPGSLQRVRADDAGRLAQGNAGIALAALESRAAVHEVVRHPQGRLGDARREGADFDAVELVDGDPGEPRDIDLALPCGGGIGAQLADHVDFEQAQLAVGDDEEVAAAAGGVEEGHLAELLAEGAEGVAARVALALADTPEGGAQGVQEQGRDDLEDVLLGGVVGTLGAAPVAVHDRLEEGAEDRARDAGPVEVAGLDQEAPGGGGEPRRLELVAEQLAVDKGEAGEVLVETPAAEVGRRVEDMEQVAQLRAEVPAVLAGARFDVLEEAVAGLENAGVVGKQAEHEPHEPLLEAGHGPAGLGEFVLPDELGRLDVDRILVAAGPLARADDEPAILDMGGKVLQCEGGRFVLVKVVELEGAEVAQQQVARQLGVPQAGEVIQGLLPGLGQVASGALLFHEQHALPEQVDEASLVPEPLDRLLERGDPAQGDAEDLAERAVEELGVRPFAACVLPVASEASGAGANLVPGKAHSALPDGPLGAAIVRRRSGVGLRGARPLARERIAPSDACGSTLPPSSGQCQRGLAKRLNGQCMTSLARVIQCSARRHCAPEGAKTRPAKRRPHRMRSERLVAATNGPEASRGQWVADRRLSDHAGRNASEHRAGLAEGNAQAGST